MPTTNNSVQIEEAIQRRFERKIRRAKKQSPADRDFYEAALFARRSIRASELLPSINTDGKYHYTVRQGLKAACHGREDIAATLLIQRSILQLLYVVRNVVLVCVPLLVYVAFRVS